MENYGNDYSDYRDPIENTDGIYISITEELPYERKTEDSYLEFPKESVLAAAVPTAVAMPLVLPKTRTRRKRTKRDKKKKTKRDKKKKTKRGGKKRTR